MEFHEVMETLAKTFEGIGVAIIVIGGLEALLRGLVRGFAGHGYFDVARRRFGRPLLLGLEVLVAADIIQTVTVDLSLDSILILGMLVLVRVVLSFSLDIEVEGVLPWRRAQYEQSTAT
jgi:uncharacterized membrane protein